MKKIRKINYSFTFRALILLVFFVCVFNFNHNVFFQNTHAFDGVVDNHGNLSMNTGLEPDLPSVGDYISGKIADLIKYLIHIFFVVPFSWLTTFGADISGKLMDPAILNSIFLEKDSSTVLYNIWIFVRDIFNVFFIFVLLFSAFATVFQVQKYHLLKSNVLVMIIIMALLVNFSWPITRAIMDAGNISMYYLIDTFLEVPENSDKGAQLFGALVDGTGLIKMLTLSGDAQQKAYDSASVVDQMVSTVFLLFFAITFLTIAIIFLVRTALFVLLLILSPIGFAAAIFPGTKRFADMWWSNMLKWTFIGPIMVFTLVISTKYIMTMRSLSLSLHNGAGYSSNSVVNNAIIYVSGLVMLWSGMTAANKMGGSVAGAVTSRATKFRNMGLRAPYRGIRKVGGIVAPAMIYGTGNIIGGKTVGTVSGKLHKIKDSVYNTPKEAYKKQRERSTKLAQGGHIASSVDKEEQREYEKTLSEVPNTDLLIAKAQKENKNENERKAARALLQKKYEDENKTKKSRIETEEHLIGALNAVRDDTKAMEKIFKVASKDIFKNSHASLYKKIKTALEKDLLTMNTSDPNYAIEEAKVKKQLKLLRKSFADNKRADVVYDHYLSEGATSQVSLSNATSSLKTVSDIAKQKKLLDRVNSDATIKTYTDAIIESPTLRNALLSKLDTKLRSKFNPYVNTVVANEKTRASYKKELAIINKELKALNYINPLSPNDTIRKTHLEARKTHLEGWLRVNPPVM